MNIPQLLNVSSDRLYDLLNLGVSNNDNNYSNWFHNLKKNNIDITKYILILKGIDNNQWKNLYLFLYSRWEKTRVLINKKHNKKMTSLPIYNKKLDIKETIYNFINDNISLELFFLNSLQIYFLPNPN